MLSYMSLLVLVLATSAVCPVRAANSLEVERTSHSESREIPRLKITPGRLKVLAGLGVLKLVVVGIIVTNLLDHPHLHSNNNNPINTSQPTSTTQPTSPHQPTPTISPEAFDGQEVCTHDRRGLSVDTSSVSYPRSYLGGIADSVVTTIGHSEARLISANSDQKMRISSLNSLNRAHLGEALRQFSRMLDELD